MIIRTIVVLALLCAAGTADAQSRGKKLYCWNDADGNRTCGDTLPPGATDLARTELSAASGTQTREVARALTAEELAVAREAAAKAQAEAKAEAKRLRRDLAMVQSYATEADLRRAYGERTNLLDDALKASAMGESNLRRSLVVLLDQANDLQLADRPIPANLLASLRSQHAELIKQQRIIAEQRADRASLEVELADALERYRALKNPDAAEPAPTP